MAKSGLTILSQPEREEQELAPQLRERGVRNPYVVDLVSYSEERDEVVLTMIEDRAWGNIPQQRSQLEEKVNRYLGFVLDGFLCEQYPRFAGKPVAFVLECVAEPSGKDIQMLEAVKKCCAEYKIRFETNVIATSISCAEGPQTIPT